MTNIYSVVIGLLGKHRANVEIADKEYESKSNPSLPEGDPQLLVHWNRGRTLATLITLAVAAGFCPARLCRAQDTQQSCTLRIHVDGLRNHKGVVGALVFASPVGWPENVRKSFRNQSAPIAADSHSVTVEITNLPSGNYGIVVLHDENENMKLDRNMFGVPKEGFGFSNNPNVGLRAPSFASALMHVACPATDTTIQIIYK